MELDTTELDPLLELTVTGEAYPRSGPHAAHRGEGVKVEGVGVADPR